MGIDKPNVRFESSRFTKEHRSYTKKRVGRDARLPPKPGGVWSIRCVTLRQMVDSSDASEEQRWSGKKIRWAARFFL